MSLDIDARRSTVNATARRVGVHSATVWRWILTGVRGRRLPAMLIGGRRYILESDLQEFLTAGNAPSREPNNEFARRAGDAARQLEAMGITGITPTHNTQRTGRLPGTVTP